MMARTRYFRGIRLLLECGHEHVEVTSFYRLSKGRAACIVGDRIHKAPWCFKCGASCQPEKYLGTCRADAHP